MQKCIDACWQARTDCERTLFTHCLNMGGAHTEPEHVKLMADCIDFCQTAADFMLRKSRMHVSICLACADVCGACADSCEKIGGAEMLVCAVSCRKCAELCREMAS